MCSKVFFEFYVRIGMFLYFFYILKYDVVCMYVFRLEYVIVFCFDLYIIDFLYCEYNDGLGGEKDFDGKWYCWFC